MEFKGTEYKLNSMLEVIYETEEGYLAITMGRLYDYDNCKYISLDLSEESYWELENTIKIPKNKIKSIRKVNFGGWSMWR